MRLIWTLPLLASLAVLALAQDPVPLLRPVVPGPERVRVRLATSEEKVGFLHLAGRVPKADGKKGDLVDVRVAFEVRPGRAMVAAKKWQRWGYQMPANKIGILPELVVSAVQLAPKPPGGGRDVEVRFSGLRVEIVEPPGNADTVLGCDLLVSLSDLTKQTDRLYEPRLYLADKFLELSVPAGGVKRLGTGNDQPTEPGVNPDPKLVPAMIATATRGPAVFSYAAVNGQSRYKTPDGKEQAVNVMVSSTTRSPGGIIMTLGAARGCGIEIEKGKDIAGMGTSFETSMARGKLKELRIGLQAGEGFKMPRDLVLNDVTVWVDKNDSDHMIWLGPEFLRAQFKDAVYGCGLDGAWKFHGRVLPERLQDVKMRPKN
jgi:hypothetical protein